MDRSSCLASNSEITMATDSGATGHFVDDELVLELNNKMVQHCAEIDHPKNTSGAGKQAVRVSALENLAGVITGKIGVKHEKCFPITVVSG